MRGQGFTFKQFHIDHSRCAMKVGTDGTLLGAWASLPEGEGRVLDIGTGTGLIAIMAAQRAQAVHITAIDIDDDCVEQARENILASPWSERINAERCSLQDFHCDTPFDVIVSNPPYFIDSLLSPDAARTTARHTASLPFEDLVAGVLRLMATNGRFSLILPPAEYERFLSAARGRLFIIRLCEVWSTPESGTKRIMAEFSTLPPAEPPTVKRLIIEDRGPQGYSEEYKTLTQDFYLKF